MSNVRFRDASPDEAEIIASLIVRLKSLNEEFDSHLKVREDVHKNAVAYVKESLNADRVLLHVAEASNKIVGVLRAELRDRLFYDPPESG